MDMAAISFSLAIIRISMTKARRQSTCAKFRLTHYPPGFSAAPHFSFLPLERHANGPPSGPNLSYRAALWPTRIVFKNASEHSQGLNQIFPGYDGVFTSRLRDDDVKICNGK